MLTQGASMFFKSLVKFKRGEDVLVVSAPPTLPFVTAAAAKIRRAEYILIIQDKYPETLVAVGKLKKNSVFTKILNNLNVKLYRGAKKIIVVGRDMGELVGSQATGEIRRDTDRSNPELGIFGRGRTTAEG